MTACITLIPTKVNAATLTIAPGGEIPKKTGDLIKFTLVFTPTSATIVTIKGLISKYDNSELSSLKGMQLFSPGSSIIDTTPIGSGEFIVGTPVKDGIGDVSATILYDEEGPLGKVTGLTLSASGGDVVPVPEPLTIFGTATALGCGAILKRKSSKKKVS
jgi:hypothetical protein